MTFDLGHGLDQAGQGWKAMLAGMAAIARHPSHIVADGCGAGLDAAVVLVDHLDAGQARRGRVGKVGGDLVMEGRLVALEGEDVVCAFR